jgi:hypothetical protein
MQIYEISHGDVKCILDVSFFYWTLRSYYENILP